MVGIQEAVEKADTGTLVTLLLERMFLSVPLELEKELFLSMAAADREVFNGPDDCFGIDAKLVTSDDE